MLFFHLVLPLRTVRPVFLLGGYHRVQDTPFWTLRHSGNLSFLSMLCFFTSPSFLLPLHKVFARQGVPFFSPTFSLTSRDPKGHRVFFPLSLFFNRGCPSVSFPPPPPPSLKIPILPLVFSLSGSSALPGDYLPDHPPSPPPVMTFRFDLPFPLNLPNHSSLELIHFWGYYEHHCTAPGFFFFFSRASPDRVNRPTVVSCVPFFSMWRRR